MHAESLAHTGRCCGIMALDTLELVLGHGSIWAKGGGAMTTRTSGITRFGGLLATAGGALAVIAFFLPWVVIHGYADSAPQIVFYSGWCAATASGLILFLPSLLPLLMGALALVLGRAYLAIPAHRTRRMLLRVAVVLGLLALAWIVNSLNVFDPSSLPGATASIAPGLYVMVFDCLTIIAGTTLAGLWRPHTAGASRSASTSLPLTQRM